MVALVGRPNVGKSTLLNTLLGQKLAIMSDRPQTTRSVVRGVLHRPDGQAVFLDTPRLHKPRTLLGQRLNDLVQGTLAEVDLPAGGRQGRIGRGDQFLAGGLARIETPTLRPGQQGRRRHQGADHRRARRRRRPGGLGEVVPLSAQTGEGVELLVELLMANLPEGPALYRRAMSATSQKSTCSPRSSARRPSARCATSCPTRSPW